MHSMLIISFKYTTVLQIKLEEYEKPDEKHLASLSDFHLHTWVTFRCNK